MKHMKRIVGFMLALVMLLTLTVTVFAEETYTITISNKNTGYTYEAYQIFAGDLEVTTDAQNNTIKTLSNITWGSGVTDAGKNALLSFGKGGEEDPYEDAAALAAALTDSDAPAFAAEAAGYFAAAAGTADTPSNGGYTISGLEPGYYLIRNTAVPKTDSAYTGYILQVVGNVTVTPKSAVPTVDKQVQDETADAETGADNEGWGETADHDIGETFRFRLIADIPDEDAIDAYESYQLVFRDTMSAGVTFESIESVTVNGKSIDEAAGDVAGYTYDSNTNQDGTTSLTVTVANLKAHVTGSIRDAVVVVTYKAHLNKKAVIGDRDDNKNTVYLEYSNNPHSETTGKTVEDTVYVFTYELVNTKVIGGAAAGTTPTPLNGAGFKLKNAEGKWYKVDASTKSVSWMDNEADGTEMRSGQDGKFTFSGLDVGTYTLKETTTPPGYNTCSDVTVVIGAVHAETDDGASSAITINGESGAVGVSVENYPGSHLPSTGGMGTTIFYVAGSVLLIGAGILLVTRRRMNGDK